MKHWFSSNSLKMNPQKTDFILIGTRQTLSKVENFHICQEAAIANYERALAADPFNNLAPYQRKALEDLQTPEAASP